MVGVLMLIGCTGDKIVYPDAPIVSIKETSVEWVKSKRTKQFGAEKLWEGWVVEIRYILEAKEPLPYDIKVKLIISRRSETQDNWTGILDTSRSYSMKRGVLIAKRKLILNYFDYFNHFNQTKRPIASIDELLIMS